jgi:hypothetical protein
MMFDEEGVLFVDGARRLTLYERFHLDLYLCGWMLIIHDPGASCSQ